MKKLFPIFFILLIGCSTSFTRKRELQYQVVRQSIDPVTYNVSYTTKNGATKSEGPIESSIWRSDNMKEAEGSLDVELNVKILSGSGTLELRILRDGAIHESSIMEPPSFEGTVKGKL